MRVAPFVVLLGACGFHGASPASSDGRLADTDLPVLDVLASPDASHHDAGAFLDAPVIAAVCPTSANWITIGTAHYYLSQSGNDKTWWDAEAACEAMTMTGPAIHLATFSSTAEALALAPSLLVPTTWVGMFQPLGESQPSAGWEWITGDAGILDWSPGEPNDGGSGGEHGRENFSEIFQTGLINDTTGTDVLHWVCRCDGVAVSAAAAAQVPAKP